MRARKMSASKWVTRAGLSDEDILEADLPFMARFIMQFEPWQLVLIGALAALVLLMMPSTMFLWELRKLIAP